MSELQPPKNDRFALEGVFDCSQVEAVLFDLGGVLVELQGGFEFVLGESLTEEDAWEAWISSEWVRRFETGSCSPEEFAAGLVDSLSLPISPEEFLRRFESWPASFHPQAAALLDSLAGVVRLGCFSNTNVVHWERHLSRWPKMDLFEWKFLSFQLKAAKPDERAFAKVSELMGLPPAKVLFIDDVGRNVEGARRAGFLAFQAKGAAEARALLVEAGLLSPSPAEGTFAESFQPD
jgi:HAD superfamily hydrolase (TIGR01509 family)